MQSYDCITELVIFFNGLSKFFTANPAWIRENLSKAALCVLFLICKAKVSVYSEEGKKWKL